MREGRSRSRDRGRSSSRSRGRDGYNSGQIHRDSFPGSDDKGDSRREDRRRSSRDRSRSDSRDMRSEVKRKRHKKEKKEKRSRTDRRRSDSRSRSRSRGRRHRSRSRDSSRSRSSSRGRDRSAAAKRPARHDSDSEDEEVPRSHAPPSSSSSVVAQQQVAPPLTTEGAEGGAMAAELTYTDPSNNEADATESAESLNNSEVLAQPKISKMDFFAQLRMQESRRGSVGTVHAKSKASASGGMSATAGPASQDWNCPKCGASNYKHFNECQKCHALKRLTTYR